MSVQETPIAAARRRFVFKSPGSTFNTPGLSIGANSQLLTTIAMGQPPKGKMWLVEYVTVYGLGATNTQTNNLVGNGSPQLASLDISEDGGTTWVVLVYDEQLKGGASLPIGNKVAVAEDELLRLSVVIRNDTATVSQPTLTVTAQVLEVDPVMDGPKGTSVPANALLVIDD